MPLSSRVDRCVATPILPAQEALSSFTRRYPTSFVCGSRLKEELGIDREPLRLISVDWAPNEREGDKLLFLFDCGNLGADEARIRLPADELDRKEWVELSRLDDYVIDRISNRIRAAAVLSSSATYLEYGRPAFRAPSV